MNSLVELQPFKYNIVEKESRKGVLLTIGGVFQRAEDKNANGRIYPRELWVKTLQNEELRTRLENRRMVGQLGHPAAGSSTDPEKLSHVVTKLELRGDNTIYGEADILDTPIGRIAETLFRAGVGLGISSRGDGSIEKKGAYNEVQNDYKFETMDFVLRPSTDGAYPSIVENIEENEKLIADALEGLVNGELPSKQKVPVLLECFKILSVLDANDSADGNRYSRLSKRIMEELGSDAETTVLASVVAKELPAQPVDETKSATQQERIKEDSMSSSQTLPMVAMPAVQPQGQIDPSTLQWHQQQVQYAVDQAVGPKENEISSLKNSFIQGQREHTATKQRLAAAESLINDFQLKVKGLEEGGDGHVDEALQQRYAAAVELLDEALKRLPEINQQGRRIEALEGLLQASIDKFKSDGVAGAVAECMQQVPDALEESVQPVLEHCQTPEQVYDTFKALCAVSGSQTQRRNLEPLPFGISDTTVGSQNQLQEQANQVNQVNENVRSVRTFSSRLNSRLLRAV